MTDDTVTGLEIAVIGMAGRFPGARNIYEYWENLKYGIESISFFSDEELIREGIDPGLLKDTDYVKAAGIIDDIEFFDSSFFGYTPRDTEIMDPQVRFFLECSWEAFEDAGYVPDTYDGLIGVFAGAAENIFWRSNLVLSDNLGSDKFMQTFFNSKEFMTMLISYKLNLKGPSFMMFTACSTSLVSIHNACQAILNGECDMALAGGVKISIPNKKGYLYQPGMIFSPDGHCRAFDANAQGTLSGNGVGVVVLKRLEESIRDRDHIYAVIKGSAINNDGLRKVGFTAPSIEGQTEAIRTAQQMAHVEPESITYVETHGTGTELGDPVEIEGLKSAFKTDKKGFCALGSVKTNIGHLDTAAGVAGFIKTVLALKNKQIPPSLYFKTLNPQIDIINSPFIVNTGLLEWENNGRSLRAGVSSFGIGGTNAHVVLEEAPAPAGSSGTRDFQLLLLSARTQSALERMTENFITYLEHHPDINIADMAYTLMMGRKHFKYRKIAVCSSGKDAIEAFSGREDQTVYTANPEEENKPVIFMFPDQGAQYIDMGLGLYKTEPVFRQEMERCFEILKPLLNLEIKDIIYPSDRSDKSDRSHRSDILMINQTEIAQPILFVFEFALAKLLMSWGIEPYAMIGHGIGEYTAACLSGVFSLEDALKIVSGKSMQQMPTGSMTRETVRFSEGIETLSEKEHSIFIEVGPGNALCTLVRQHKNKKNGHLVLEAVRHPGDQIRDDYFLISKMGRLWLQGVKIDRSKFYSKEKRSRIPLPLYPFERNRYRVKIGLFDAGETGMVNSFAAKKKDKADCLYTQQWLRSTPVERGYGMQSQNRWLLFSDDSPLCNRLVKRLEQDNHHVVVVKAGDSFREMKPGEYTVNPGTPGDYDRLFKTLVETGKAPGNIAHMWCLPGIREQKPVVDSPDPVLELGLFSLLDIARAIGKTNISEKIQLGVITGNMQFVTGDEQLYPEKAAILGPVKVIPLEYANISCRSIDITEPGENIGKIEFIIENLLREFSLGFGEQPVVAYRGACRWLESYQKIGVNIDKSSTTEIPSNRLKERGVYLITGGFGGMGFVLAGHLVNTLKAKLILVDILTPPTGEKLDKWLYSDERKKDIHDKKQKIKEWETRGAEILVQDMDVSDYRGMKEVISLAEERFGPINGVIHTAGLIDYAGVIQRRTREMTDALLAAKIKGTLVLDRLLSHHQLDFMVLFSSIGNVLYKIKFGQVGYNAGHEFMEIFSYYKQQQGQYTITIDWDDWAEVGMAVRAAQRRNADNNSHSGNRIESENTSSITPGEGIDIFLRILENNVSRVVVSYYDLQQLLEFRRYPAQSGTGTGSSGAAVQETDKVYDRPEISTDYVPPTDEMEQFIIDIWEKIFGFKKIGIMDDWFELGGDSLTVIHLISRIKEVYPVEISVNIFFENPTISGLAEMIKDLLYEKVQSLSEEELEALMEQDIIP